MARREQEEEYFAEQECLKRKKLREELDKKREEQKKQHLKETHWMKCPKCGHDLKELQYQDVLIDQCTNCKGVYLDPGELELLLDGRKGKGFISKFLKVHIEDVSPP